MSYAPIGEVNSSDDKTPTLRQLLKSKEGKVPLSSPVKIIFAPNKFANFTLVTDAGYRVSIPETSGLYSVLQNGIEGFHRNGTSLAVTIVDKEKATWQLTESTNDLAEWEVTDWGWRLSVLRARTKAERTKAPTV